jgi:hypothetical protein
MEYFDDGTWKASGNGQCCDPECVCGRTHIERGEGFLYVSPEVAVFRRIYRSHKSALKEMEQRVIEKYGRPVKFTCRIGPMLICKRAAQRRQLDLDIARMDAKFWWEHGKAPLRATPHLGSMEALEERLTRID